MQLVQAIASIPSAPDVETIVVVDHNDTLRRRVHDLAQDLPDGRPPFLVVQNTGPRGISGARNTGVAHARGDVVVFLDDDAVGRPGWLGHLLEAFDDPKVVVAGGLLAPAWECEPSGWHPRSFFWVFGCSWLGLPETRQTVRNVIGACMAARRSTLEQLGGFATVLGRSGVTPLGCDETELCIRAGRLGAVVYVPSCVADHHVPDARLTLGYFVRRCWSEGLSKAAVSQLVGSSAALASERRHIRTMVAEAVDALMHGRPAQACAICLGATVAAAGYVRGRSRRLLAERRGRAGALCP